MFIANKNITTVDKIFYKGQVIPEKYVSDYMKQIGAVLFKKDDKKVEVKKDAEVKKDLKPKKEEILIDESSKVTGKVEVKKD